MRRGFSLVEALVALALFQIGMLALAATTAVAARDLASATRRARATALARNGVQLLRLTACAGGASNAVEELAGGYTEIRRVVANGAGLALVDSVVYALPAGKQGRIVLRAWVTCT